MAGKKKPTRKGSAAATGAANKTAGRARTEKAGRRESGATKASSQPRKKAGELGRHQEALLLSEAIYQQIVDTMEDSITVLDADGIILFANSKAALNLSGGAPSTVVGKNISQFVPKAQAEQLIDKYRRVITTGQPLEQEVMVTLQGVDRWFLNSLRPVSFGAHNIPALVSSSRDITERKKMEEVLLDSEMRYRTLFKQSGDYILVMKIGKDGVPVITDMNETALRAHGYSREEMMGRPIAFLDPVTDLRDNDERIKALKKGKLELFTTQHRRKDGSLFDVEVRAQLIRINGEQVIVSTERDITERKRMEEALGASQKLLESIFEAAPT